MTKYLLCIALAVVVGESISAQAERRDGNWWNARPRGAKVEYVVGFFDGMELGSSFTKPACGTGPDGRIDRDAFDDHEELSKRYRDAAAKYFNRVTNGQLTDGIDEFYKDFRNRSILLYYAMEVVVRQIAGEDVEPMIISLRKAG